MRKLIGLTVGFILLSGASFADSPLKIGATGGASSKFTLSESTPLTASVMDYAWANRENLANQKTIADYLQTAPVIPNDYETAWKTARMVYFIGNFGAGEKQFVSTSAGVKLFDYGVSAGKVAIGLKPTAVEGQYWYAVDLGSYGLAKGILASASSAGDGMDALKKAIAVDPAYQWNGSSRILGRYYQELPGIFGGSNKKALELLTTATAKSPQFRNNWVFLGQYYISTGNSESALEVCQKALTLPNQDGKYEELRYTREAQACITKAKAKLGSGS